MARDDQAKSGKYFICQVSFNLVALAFICLLILILWRGHKDRQNEELISAAEENMEECQRMYRCDDMENENRGKHKRGWSRQSDTICGSDGLHYNSECELNVVACQFPEINLVATDQSSCSSFNSVILIGGKSPSEGNIYARNERTGQFGPVCDDGWSFYGANVVCKQLGYSGAYKFTMESYFGQVTPSFSYHFLKCSGHEYSINDCKNSFYSECSEFEAAGVICNHDNSTPVGIGGNGNGFPSSWSPPPLNTYTNPQTILEFNHKTETPKLNTTGCYETNVGYFGNEIGITYRVSNFRDCQILCLNDTQCNAFTFSSRLQSCYLKSKIATKLIYEGAISGPKICTNRGK